jgi:hypothetical protein
MVKSLFNVAFLTTEPIENLGPTHFPLEPLAYRS